MRFLAARFHKRIGNAKVVAANFLLLCKLSTFRLRLGNSTSERGADSFEI